MIDASVAISWCLDDEESEEAERVIARLEKDPGVAPAIWPFEVANTVLSALRRQRLKEADLPQVHALLASLPISLESTSADRSLSNLLPLAREHGLTVYDASYLELALRTGYPLATLDIDLRAAAMKIGVQLVGD